MIAVILGITVVVSGIGLLALVFVLRIVLARRIRTHNGAPKGPTIAFLHPFALSGGGGERVLWTAIRAIHKQIPTAHIIIYGVWTSSSACISKDRGMVAARKSACARFGLDLSGVTVETVDISDMVRLVEPSRYPRFTLALQATGMVLVGARSFYRRPASIVIDTANMSFSLIVPYILGAYTISYVHYPTISTDMLTSVARRETAVHNDAATAASKRKTAVKLVYYKCFAGFYAFSAKFINCALANSSWTASHLRCIWGYDVDVLFPPCDVRLVDSNGDNLNFYGDIGREPGLIVSVGQFRPEKRHENQLEIIKNVLQNGKTEKIAVRLVTVGGVRDDKDVRRAEKIERDAKQKNLPVTVCVNASVEDLRKWLDKGTIGLHTMRHEHFGISVVELMQAGLIVVAHGSGGVAMDIVKHGVNGFLADSDENFAQVIRYILQMTTEQKRQMRSKAAKDCQRFSRRKFEDGFVRALRCAIDIVGVRGLGGARRA